MKLRAAFVFLLLGLTACHASDKDPSLNAQNPVIADADAFSNIESARLKRYAAQFSRVVLDELHHTVDAELSASREALAKARADADEKYKEAKARGEKVKPPAKPKLELDDRIRGAFPSLAHDKLIAELYDVENSPVAEHFVRNDGALTALGSVIIDTVKNADLHALDPEDFKADRLESFLARYAQMAQNVTQPAGLFIHPRELAVIEKSLKAGIHVDDATFSMTEFEQLDEQTAFARLTDIVSREAVSPVPRLAAAKHIWRDRIEFLTKYRDWTEFSFAEAALAWIEQMKSGNLEKFSKEEMDRFTTEDNPNDIHPKHYQTIIDERLKTEFSAIVQVTSESEIKSQLDQLIPAHDQYARLQKARERYQEIVANGGWNEVLADNMNKGGRAPLVTYLKKRLAVEGYFTDDVSNDLFDDALEKAILSYQKHHQLDETGKVDQVFWRSLNVKAEQRLAEIEVNIRRWHRTMFVPKDRYIYINIPSFTVELWDQGKLVDTHKTIVGNSTRICNSRTREWERMNATHLLHSRMTYIVFNPYWNVPPRIEVDEYQKKMAENPKWLEQSDFEYYTPKGGGRVLRQKPGPNNALGKVKLIFPNRYNIYLHDTPKQTMFNYSVRAFSHGCMRVENAMKFAESVLKVDGQWDKARIDKFFVEKGEHAVDLNTPIDVFIEYHTVTVDDEGQPYFLADVYKIIKDQIQPPTALERACDPAVDKVSSFRSGASAGDTGP